ncbi:MAG: type I-E CRISPR-associated protein Cas7/Cse4/CasC [Solirubrobacterales bacterium]
MYLDLHILQSFAPANLNRDDTGSPKECVFGGARRARISSQSLKRAIREAFRDEAILPPERLATRTKQVVKLVADRLIERGWDETDARTAVGRALRSIGWNISDEGESDALALVAHDQVEALAIAIERHREVLTATEPAAAAAAEPRRGRGRAKPQANVEVSTEAKREFHAALDLTGSIDLALFGRFIADLPDKNIDGAAYVAHSLSTHALDAETDYFTAVDELQMAAEQGAGMLGLQGFNASLHYRYATLNLRALDERLGDPEAVRLALEAFVRASVAAIPSGKQHGHAAFNRPAFVLAVVRDDAPESLANAFLRPVHVVAGDDLLRASITALEAEWRAHRGMYGEEEIRCVAVASLATDGLGVLEPRTVSLEALITAVGEAAVSPTPQAQVVA